MKKKYSEEMSLLEAAQHFFPDSTVTTVRSLIKLGRVSIAGRIWKDPKKVVCAGEEVRIWPKTETIKQDLQILHEDPHFVVVNKPVGLLSVEANYEKVIAAHTLLKDRYRPGRVLVVHRLDREVSGLMLFAKTHAGLTHLKKSLEKREIRREYAALVEGELQESAGKWESYLVEDEEYVVRSSQDSSGGELAITHYKVVKRSKEMTQLQIKLETGRKNQIRVHCQESGHPIIGDKKYGSKKNPVGRLCLHSYLLKVPHPITGKVMEFETPLPEEFFLCWEKA